MADLGREFDRACAALDGADFDALPERDRILVAIWGLEADVNNGGFDQYYFNSSGDHAYFASAALKTIGAATMATIVDKANAHFGPEGPPRARALRQQRLEELTAGNAQLFDELDRQFIEYPDDVSALLVAYLDAAS